MSAIPQGDPGTYRFSQADDRKAQAGGVGEDYRALAAAEEQLAAMAEPQRPDLDPRLQTAIRTALRATRRAGFLLIVSHGEETGA